MPFETIQSETTYQGRVFHVRRDQVKLPNGHLTHLDIVSHAGAVAILPHHEGQIWFVRQYRHAAGQELLELPAGGLEPGEEPAACAQRELQEEIGMAATTLQRLGTIFLAPGYSTELLHIFFADGLTPSRLPGDEDEIIHLEKFSVEQVYALVEQDFFKDAKTLAVLALARPLLLGRK